MLIRSAANVSRPATATVALVVILCAVGCGADESRAMSAVASSTPASSSADRGTTTVEADALAASGPPLTAAVPPEPAQTPVSAAARSDAAAPRPSPSPRPATAATPPPLATSRSGRPDTANSPSATSAPAPLSPSQAKSRLDLAIEARDVCELYVALAELEVSGKSVQEFRRGMVIVLDAVRRAESFVPAELAPSWRTLVEQTERVVDVLGEPDATVSSASSVFADSTYREAMDRTDEWMDESCVG